MHTRKPRQKTQTFTLLISDNAADQALIAQRLRAASPDIQLIVAQSGPQALAQLQDRLASVFDFPSLVLLDAALLADDPDWSLVTDLKQSFPNLPLILLGTGDSPEKTERVYRSGAQTYLIKSDDMPTWIKQLDTLAEYWFDVVSLPRLQYDWVGKLGL